MIYNALNSWFLKPKYVIITLTWLCCCLRNHSAFAQLQVSGNSDGATLVGQIIGNNVTVSNVVISCNTEATGVFYSGSAIGIAQGILLCTGKAITAQGPNDDNSAGYAFSHSGNFNDPDIQNVESDARYDGCVLEFDIKPICTKLEIKYVFASEEYPEFAGANVNDAFGFFITGANPSGGSYNGFNIARLPNGTPISINTLNNGTNNNGPCVNCAYYLENTGSSTQYDGFTVPLTASVNVVPCNTYHLKLAIADGGDAIYDSGVFLQYKGIGCSPSTIPSTTTNTTASACDLNNGSALVSVSNYTGTVTYLWNPGGQTTAHATDLAPGDYTCTVSYQNPCPFTQKVAVTVPHVQGFTYTNTILAPNCPQDATGSVTVSVNNGTSPYTYNWNTVPFQTTSVASNLSIGQYICTIQDASGCIKKDTVKIFASTTLTLNPVAFSAYCGNATGSITANVTGGAPAYSYTYTSSPPQYTSVATNLLPGTYSLTIKDQDGCRYTKQVTVSNTIPNITLTDSVIPSTCTNPNGAIYINAISGGNAPYTYTWTTTPIVYTQSVTQLSSGVYTVNIRDLDNCPVQKVYTINNLSYLPMLLTKQDEKCRQKTGFIDAFVIGGTSPYAYQWSDGQVTQQANHLGEGSYTVTITDALGCSGTTTIGLVNVDDVFNGDVIMSLDEPEVNAPFIITLDPTSVWSLNYAVGSDSVYRFGLSNTFNYENYGDYNITYYLTSNDGCKHTLKYDFFVKDFMTIYVPNTFTPNSDRTNDGFCAKGTLIREFEMWIFDRWGQLLFKSDDIDTKWDGTFKGNPCQIDTYIYKIIAKDYYDNSKTFVGHVNLVR